MTDIADTGLPKRVVAALEDKGIDTTDTLALLTASDIAEIPGVGPKALPRVLKLWEGLDKRPSKRTGDEEAPPAAAPKRTGPPPPSEETMTVTLQIRHANWVKLRAQADGTTTSRIIEMAVRAAWQRDPYKNGVPSEHGGTGGSVRREEHVRPPSAQR